MLLVYSMEKFYFKSNGKKLCGILEPGRRPLLLLVHGFTSSKNGRTKRYIASKLGNTLMAFDLYGHGESDGNMQDATIPIGIKNIVDAAKYARKLGYKNIILMGSSFGGLCSMFAALKIRPAAIILRSPVSSYIGRKEALKNKGASFKRTYKKYEAYNISAKINCPVLIFHGTSDERVQISQSRKLSKLLKHGKLIEIPKGKHDFTIPQMKYVVKGSRKFLEQIKGL